MSRTTRITLLEECRHDYLEIIATYEADRDRLAERKPAPDSTFEQKIAANARALELLHQSLLRVEEELKRTRASLDPE